jgi:hypothetical protein
VAAPTALGHEGAAPNRAGSVPDVRGKSWHIGCARAVSEFIDGSESTWTGLPTPSSKKICELPVTPRAPDAAGKDFDLNTKLVGGTGHYLNSRTELDQGVLDLIRLYPSRFGLATGDI